MSLDNLVSGFQEKLKFGGITGKYIKIEIEDEGVIFIDTHQMPYQIDTDRDDEADVTLSAKKETFENIINGIQDANMAFMMGKLKVKGSMGLAMKLASVLDD